MSITVLKEDRKRRNGMEHDKPPNELLPAGLNRTIMVKTNLKNLFVLVQTQCS